MHRTKYFDTASIPCENPGHRSMPAQAPIPPSPPQQGVGDPVAQLLVGQGAISHLLHPEVERK